MIIWYHINDLIYTHVQLSSLVNYCLIHLPVYETRKFTEIMVIISGITVKLVRPIHIKILVTVNNLSKSQHTNTMSDL